ncbi:MAG: hypothetical protein V2J24_23645 [Pseudomonadales bacterium]|jgi:hypothetical protein|nr:hypothetical protein [Pseudomonadales bacterium]
MSRHVLGRSEYSESSLVFEDDFVYTVETQPGPVIGAIIDHCKRIANDRSSIVTKAMGRPAATVPRVTREEWRKEWKKRHSDRLKWPEYLVMKLNSSDHKYLRTGVRRL